MYQSPVNDVKSVGTDWTMMVVVMQYLCSYPGAINNLVDAVAPYLIRANAHSLSSQVLGGLEREDPRVEQSVLPGVGGQGESSLASCMEETDTSLPAKTDLVGHRDIFTMNLSAEHSSFC